MSEFSIQLSLNTNLIASCNETLSLQVKWLLETIKNIYLQKGALNDGEKIEIGWSLLTVKEKNSNLFLLEPDYSKNPFEDLRNDVTATLMVLAQQNEILKIVKVEGRAANFHEKIVCEKDCLLNPKIYLEHSRDVSENDSGWYAGNIESAPGEKLYESFFVYQLLKIRPEILQVLVLPERYLVTFDGSNIDSIVNEKDEQLSLTIASYSVN